MGYKNTLKVNKHFSENKLTTAPRHHRFQFLRVTLSYESSNRWQNKLQPSSGSGHKILPYMRAGAWSQLCPLKNAELRRTFTTKKGQRLSYKKPDLNCKHM
uniref:Uncharacterized protein n=1 Tax=Rhipicephalus microplus TaxID=6941 RepID=A0A6G5AF35_RHIMP